MYLFTRSLRLNGSDLRSALAWATTMTEHVNQVTGNPVSLWNRVYSRGVGTLVFVAPVPDYTALEGLNDKLMVDEHYHELAAEGLKYIITGSIDDGLAQIVHPVEPASEPTGEYAYVVHTTCANGHLADGIAVGVELAQMATQITGVTTSFQIEDGGEFGAVSWVTVYANAAEMERAGQAQFSDPAFIELIDQKAGPAYSSAPSASMQETYRRVA